MRLPNSRTSLILLVIYIILVISASAVPGERIPESRLFSMDKLLHLLEFMVLGVLVVLSFKEITLRSFIYAIIGCLVFAAVNEFIQMMIPGRSPDVNDFIADNIGVWIGTGIAVSLKRFQGNDKADSD